MLFGSKSSFHNSARPADLQPKYRRVYFLLVGISIPLMLLIAPPASTLIFVAVLIASALIVLDEHKLVRLSIRTTLPELALDRQLRYAVEIILILVVLALSTQSLQNWLPNQRVRGSEFSYLINSGVVAANVYHKTGAIPLWDPFI